MLVTIATTIHRNRRIIINPAAMTIVRAALTENTSRDEINKMCSECPFRLDNLNAASVLITVYLFIFQLDLTKCEYTVKWQCGARAP